MANILQQATDLAKRGQMAIASARQKANVFLAPTLKDLERDYKKFGQKVSRVSSGVKTTAPKLLKLIGPTSPLSITGGISQANRQLKVLKGIPQRYETKLGPIRKNPIKIVTEPLKYIYSDVYRSPRISPTLKQFGAGVLSEGTLGRYTPPVEAPKGGKQKVARFAGELVGMTPYFEALMGSIPATTLARLMTKPSLKLIAKGGRFLPKIGKVLPSAARFGVAGTAYNILKNPKELLEHPEKLPTEFALQTGIGAAFPLAGMAALSVGGKVIRGVGGKISKVASEKLAKVFTEEAKKYTTADEFLGALSTEKKELQTKLSSEFVKIKDVENGKYVFNQKVKEYRIAFKPLIQRLDQIEKFFRDKTPKGIFDFHSQATKGAAEVEVAGKTVEIPTVKVPNLEVNIEEPVAKAVETLKDYGTTNSGFFSAFSPKFNGLKPSWAIVFNKPENFNLISQNAEKVGLSVNLRSGKKILDIYLSDVGPKETVKAKTAFDKFADLFTQPPSVGGVAVSPKQTEWIIDQIYNNEDSPEIMKDYLIKEGGISDAMANKAIQVRDWIQSQHHVVTHSELAKKLIEPSLVTKEVERVGGVVEGGVKIPMRPSQIIEPTKEQLAEFESREIAQAMVEIKAATTGSPLGNMVSKMRNFLRFAGEKTSKETGELFREHIPRSVFGISSDEVASEMGTTENELMAKLTDGLGIKEQARIFNLPSLKRKAKDLFASLDPESYTIIKDIFNKVEAVSAEPTEKTLLKIAQKQTRLLENEEKMRLRMVEKEPTILGKINELVKQIQTNTSEMIRKNKATDNQIKAILSLRDSQSLRHRELLPAIEKITGESSLTKLTKSQADEVIKFLQPRNWEEIAKEVSIINKKALEGKLKIVSEEAPMFTSKYPELEQKSGAIQGLNNVIMRIKNIAENIKNSSAPLEKPGTLLGKVAEFLPEAPGAEATGIRSSFHVHLRAVVDASKFYLITLRRGLTEVFKDLTPQEAMEVINIQAGGPKKGASEKIMSHANYLQEIFDETRAIHNMLRKVVGLDPIPRRKRYISYIIDENLRLAGKLYGKVEFDQMREKTYKEFAAGLFEKRPGEIIEIYSRSASDFLKKDLFRALLKGKFDEIQKLGGQGAILARELVNYDVYSMTSLTDRLLRSSTQLDETIPRLLSKISIGGGNLGYRQIKIDKDLADALLNTRLNKTLAEDIKNGILRVPRFQLPNPVSVVQAVFYPAALSWNFGFAILNRTQPMAGIPFIGLSNYLAASAKMHSLLLPWNSAERVRYTKILEDGGHFFNQMAAGESIPGYTGKSPVIGFVNKSVNFLAIATEYMNRLESAIGAEKFLESLSGKANVELSQAEKEAVMSRFSGFINFMSGAGYSPLKQRSTAWRLAYTFQQYPLNQMLDVYTNMYKYAIKDEGAKAFWDTIRVEAGASEKALKLFESLPSSSKSKVFEIMLALSLPPAIIYSLSGSWNVAQRAFPGMPRIALADLFVAAGEWMQDPELNLEQLKSQIGATFNPRILQRLADAYDMANTGIITTRTKGTPIFTGTNPLLVAKQVAFGRQVIPTYEEAYPEILGRTVNAITGKGTPAREVTVTGQKRVEKRQDLQKEAVKLVQDTRKVKTKVAKEKIVQDAQQRLSKADWLDVKGRVKNILKEEKIGVTPLSRRMRVLTIEDKARTIIKNTTKIRGTKNREKYLKDLKEQGILTPKVKREIKRIIKEEGLPKGGIINLFKNLLKIKKAEAAEKKTQPVVKETPTTTTTQKIKIKTSTTPVVTDKLGYKLNQNLPLTRAEVVFSLLRKGLGGDEIKSILLTEPNSDWTKKEIDKYIGAFGAKIFSGKGGKTNFKKLLTMRGKVVPYVKPKKIKFFGPADIKVPPSLKIQKIQTPSATFKLRLPLKKKGLKIYGKT